MRRRMPLATAGLLLLAAALGWWLLGAREDGPSASGLPPRAGPATTTADPLEARSSPAGRETGTPAHLRGRAPAPTEGGEAPTAGSRITGLVVDTDDAPAAGATVLLARLPDPDADDAADAGGADEGGDVAQRRANAAGRFTFADLRPGRYRLVALAPPGRFGAEVLVDLDEAGADVVLAWRAALRARVEVVDEAGQPVAGAAVTARWEGAQAHGKTDETGLVTLDGLPPHRTPALEVRPPSDRALHRHRRSTWEVGDTRVVLRRTYEIAGRVVDEHGAPFPRARVIRADGNRTHVLVADDEGRFRLRRLEPGIVRLAAAPPAAMPLPPEEGELAWQEVEAGAGDVALVAHRGATLVVRIADWPPGGRGELVLRTEGSDERHAVRIGGDGVATAHGLDEAATYTVWATREGDERLAFRRGVRPQAEALVLALEEGPPIVVRVEAPEGVVVRTVFVEGDGFVRGAVRPVPNGEGLWRLPTMPPGTWTVHAAGLPAGDAPGGGFLRPARWTHKGEAAARSGEEVTVRLRPTPDR